MEAFLAEELERMAVEPAFSYLAANGDAIEARINACRAEAVELLRSGYAGASLVRATSGLELTIRFFLARPLVQGAFLSEGWAALLAGKMFTGQSSKDRDLLPAIVRHWGMDVTAVRLAGGAQAWEAIINRVWPLRNDYVHKGAHCAAADAETAIEALEAMLREIVAPLARRLGFTRDETGCWSIVAVTNPAEFPDLNPPHTYSRDDPFGSDGAA